MKSQYSGCSSSADLPEFQPAFVVRLFRFAIELVRVVEGEDDVDEEPRQDDRAQCQRGGKRAGSFARRIAQFDEDRHQACCGRRYRERQDQRAAFVLLLGALAHTVQVEPGDHERGGHQIEGDRDVPCDERPRGGAHGARQHQEQNDPERRCNEQLDVGANDPHRFEARRASSVAWTRSSCTAPRHRHAATLGGRFGTSAS